MGTRTVSVTIGAYLGIILLSACNLWKISLFSKIYLGIVIVFLGTVIAQKCLRLSTQHSMIVFGISTFFTIIGGILCKVFANALWTELIMGAFIGTLAFSGLRICISTRTLASRALKWLVIGALGSFTALGFEFILNWILNFYWDAYLPMILVGILNSALIIVFFTGLIKAIWICLFTRQC